MSRLDAVTFTAGTVDRAAQRRTDPTLLSTLLADQATRVLELGADRFAATADGELVVRAPVPDDRSADLVVFLGEVTSRADGVPAEGRTAYVLVVPELAPTPAGKTSGPARPGVGLRELAEGLDGDTAALVATSLALANWHRDHRRCSRCGAHTEPALAGWIRRCVSDGSEHYPRTDLAVIMAVTDDEDRLLLGRSPAWPSGRMSILAGFVEPGETLEQAVAREVGEEVGIEVRDVTYVADQPWPFPSSLMVGFTARAVQVDLTLDERELAEARWVSREDVRSLIARGEYRPSPGFSISRALVEDWFGGPLPSAPAGP